VTSASERFRALAVRLALVVGSFTGHAVAADDYTDNDTRTAARALAAQGSAAYEAGDFQHALELFERAGAIIPAPTITLMEARTLVELGRLVDALERYDATEHMLDLDPTNPAYVDAAATAQREKQPLLERIPTLRVRVEGVLPGELYDVIVDGKKVQPALAAVDRPSDPGPHRVEATTSRGRSAKRELTLVERAHEDVELVLAPLPPPPAPTPAAPPPAPTKVAATNPLNTLGWALVISGAAFTAVGTITGVMALGHKHDLDAVCTPGCPPTMADTLDAFRRERAVSYTTFVLGGLSLAGGTYLVLTEPSKKVALYVTPNHVALAGQFR
jgi:hypothetical protein